MAGTINHEWNGTVLTITSDSGTSSADLKGDKGDDGARGPQGAPGDCVATDTAALGGIAAAEYALKNEIPTLEEYATKDYINSAIENVNVDYAYNLLDNSNFLNPINQRGNTTYSGAIYGIDRWVGMSRSNITITEEGIRLSNNTPSSGNCYWQQIIPTKLVEEGKNYTIAAEIDGKIYVNSGTTPNNISVSHGNGTIMLLYSTVSNSYVFRVVLNSGFEGSITVKWVGLYKQNYTVEDIPDYQPKGYAAELAECRRYYRRYGETQYSVTFTSNAKCYAAIDYTDMRITPTVVYNAVGIYVDETLYTTIEAITTRVLPSSELEVITNTTITTNKTGTIRFNSLELNADL